MESYPNKNLTTEKHESNLEHYNNLIMEVKSNAVKSNIA